MLLPIAAALLHVHFVCVFATSGEDLPLSRNALENMQKWIGTAKSSLKGELIGVGKKKFMKKLSGDKELKELWQGIEGHLKKLDEIKKKFADDELPVKESFLPPNGSADFLALVERIKLTNEDGKQWEEDGTRSMLLLDGMQQLIEAIFNRIFDIEMPLHYQTKKVGHSEKANEAIMQKVKEMAVWVWDRIRGQNSSGERPPNFTEINEDIFEISAFFVDFIKTLKEANVEFVRKPYKALLKKLRQYNALFWMDFLMKDLSTFLDYNGKYQAAKNRHKFLWVHKSFVVLERDLRFWLVSSFPEMAQQKWPVDVRGILAGDEVENALTALLDDLPSTEVKKCIEFISSVVGKFELEKNKVREAFENGQNYFTNEKEADCDWLCRDQFKLLQIHWNAPLLANQEQALARLNLFPSDNFVQLFVEKRDPGLVHSAKNLMMKKREHQAGLGRMEQVTWPALDLHIALQQFFLKSKKIDGKLLKKKFDILQSEFKQIHTRGRQDEEISETTANIVAEMDLLYKDDGWFEAKIYKQWTGLEVVDAEDQLPKWEFDILANAARVLHVAYQVDPLRRELGLKRGTKRPATVQIYPETRRPYQNISEG